MKNKFCAILICAGLLLSLSSCAVTYKSANTDNEIYTLKASSKNRMPIKVMMKNAFSINEFERIAEERFTDIDIIQIANFSSNIGTEEYSARIEHGDLADIIMTWPLEIGQEYWSERLMDLSALPQSNRYNISLLESISENGKLYYLPGPMQVRGIVYNKTLFNEKGWKVPKDYEGFVALCKTIEESGIRALQLGLGNSEVLDTAFVGFGYGSSYASPENAKRIADYDEGKGSFADNYLPAIKTFENLVENGILKESDLDITYSTREFMLFNRECAMVEDSVLIARAGESINGSKDDFALMPFFNSGENVDSDWARLYPVCYIGLNKELELLKNKAKLNKVMELLEFISTPDGQAALSADTGAMFSPLSGVAPPNIPEIIDLLPALTHDRFAVFPTLKNAQPALREGLAAMVRKELSAQELVTMVDKQNQNPPQPPPRVVLGKAASDFSLIETGNFVTDAMRKDSGCEIALFLDNGKDGTNSGKGLNGRIYKGSITENDLMRIMPDTRLGEKFELWKVTMTGENLIKTLEYSLPINNGQSGWFYYFSGLKMQFDPLAEPGKRIKKITDVNDKDIDPAREYKVAIMDYSVPDENITACEKTNHLIPDILMDNIQLNGTISPAKDGRFDIVKP